MARTRALGCIVISTFTIISGIILLISASVFAKNTNYLHDYWTQIYGLSIFNVVIGVLSIIGAISLIYVVNRQFPALTTVISGFLVFIAFLTVISITVLASGLSDLERKSYDNTVQIFRNYSDSDLIQSSKSIVGYIQQSYQCCGIEQATYWKNQTEDETSTPDSCCKKMTVGCGKGSLIEQDKIYLRGCAGIIYDDFQKKYSTLIGINVIVILFTLISALLGIICERHIRQQYQSM